MSDTDTLPQVAAAPVTLDVDDVFEKAKARASQIESEIAAQKAAKAAADVTIRTLNEELAKVNRLVGAMTPRTRTTKPSTAAAEPKKATTPAPKKAAPAAK